MRFYAVIDTNVLVSAMLKWESAPGSIIELALEGPIIPVLNEEILSEYKAVLLRPKFHLSEDIVTDIIESICKVAVFVDEEDLNIDLPNPKDRVFYEVVMEQRKTEDAYLVTGNNRHFPERPYIVTPRQMLDIILKKMST
ncbi:MAG: putative toxin-antitoxin system toxin component, PIN family [Lachnospiraceae bacterium]|nr:putative toxin-antitoxin system toxin component, PIN family [Lachnospiraceae bacterium]